MLQHIGIILWKSSADECSELGKLRVVRRNGKYSEGNQNRREEFGTRQEGATVEKG